MSDKKIKVANIETDTPDKYDGTILLVDDDEEEVFVLKRALAKTPINLKIEVAQNGQSALDFLEKCHISNGLGEVSLILLDLNMHLMDGHTFLKTIRLDERFSKLPVIVLTTSRTPDIIKKARADGADAVISKAGTLEEMMEIVDTIVQYWFKSAQKYYLA